MGSSLLMNNIYMERILWEFLYVSDLLNSIQMQPQMENLFKQQLLTSITLKSKLKILGVKRIILYLATYLN